MNALRKYSLHFILVFITMATITHGKKPGSGHPSPMDTLFSTKELGCIIGESSTTFRIFAPRATEVRLVLFAAYNDDAGQENLMTHDTNGVWEYTSPYRLVGKYYGYRVWGPSGPGEMFNPNVVVGDPYSKAVVTKNNYRHPAKSLIIDTKYDWEGDTFVIPEDHNRLVIYEGHVRDLTAHISSGVAAKGTYTGLTEQGKTGGLSYLKDLGINALELLPIQKFGTIELPYRDSSVMTETGEFNTWNPYERNHWGYMTSYFFAPETYYATDGTMDRDRFNGIDGRAVKELKNLVKTLHGENIAVILDVVYNHVSQYDYNPFKYIDKLYYFDCDSSGNFQKMSGCGNDFKTSRPMARRLIVESIKYWMREYHIDGFRFDLATMIDRETCNEISAEAKKINPHVILIAEPWGAGKYDPPGFSDIGWASWNDQIRNGVKGQNTHDGLGFIFGKFQGSNSKKTLMSYLTGTLREDGGMYLKKDHSINYLESHDDNTFGDFIRLGSGEVKETDRISDAYHNAQLTPRQLSLNKLAALYLLSAQGPIMIAEGQEFARSKVIAHTSAPDTNVGRLDHNSYEKDNETNYLNYHHKALNQELFDYYKGLIGLRRTHPAFGSAPKNAISFLTTTDDFLIAYSVDEKMVPQSKTENRFLVILNGNQTQTERIALPKGNWKIIVNDKKVSLKKPIRTVMKTVSIPPVSGMILMAQ